MDYANGKIYTIRSKETELYYIGSTTQPLSKRMYAHRYPTNDCTSKEIMKYADAYIELLELFPCANKDELNRREGQLQREFRDKIVNFKMEGQTAEDKKKYYAKYQTEHKAEILEKQHQNYERNKEENPELFREKQHQKYERNKEANKEQKSATAKEYYQKNKERIKEKQREQVLAKKAEALV
jgi:hypothetical protein